MSYQDRERVEKWLEAGNGDAYELKPIERVLLLAYAHNINRDPEHEKCGWAWIGDDKLAKRYGWEPGSLMNARTRLRSLGLIESTPAHRTQSADHRLTTKILADEKASSSGDPLTSKASRRGEAIEQKASRRGAESLTKDSRKASRRREAQSESSRSEAEGMTMTPGADDTAGADAPRVAALVDEVARALDMSDADARARIDRWLAKASAPVTDQAEYVRRCLHNEIDGKRRRAERAAAAKVAEPAEPAEPEPDEWEPEPVCSLCFVADPVMLADGSPARLRWNDGRIDQKVPPIEALCRQCWQQIGGAGDIEQHRWKIIRTGEIKLGSEIKL